MATDENAKEGLQWKEEIMKLNGMHEVWIFITTERSKSGLQMKVMQEKEQFKRYQGKWLCLDS
ncbi:hypothetical protein SD77_0557 [Bacillus badius]|uniref:Uncharacterized protein n=1 Tax=Bacillus badius TaxID=1455 RepID=A0ABR5B192_BACBA|nr:hypothetical protein SD77_0557 [Bacillus badius]